MGLLQLNWAEFGNISDPHLTKIHCRTPVEATPILADLIYVSFPSVRDMFNDN